MGESVAVPPVVSGKDSAPRWIKVTDQAGERAHLCASAHGAARSPAAGTAPLATVSSNRPSTKPRRRSRINHLFL